MNKIMFQKSKKGFTLIELMVVIAIIAILATVVLVALQGARDAAENSKRKSAVTQMRSIAEVYYATNQANYGGVFDQDASDNYEVADVNHLMGEIDFDIVLNEDGDNYCASVELTGDSGWFCVSNREGPKEYDAVTNCNTAANCDL